MQTHSETRRKRGIVSNSTRKRDYIVFNAATLEKKPERHVELVEWSYVPLVRETSL